MDIQEFYRGDCFTAYEHLGAHRAAEGGIRFRTFAPAAKAISVTGEFNDWKETPMKKIWDGNFWEVTIPEAQVGQMYKYRITRSDDIAVDHCDPYGFGMELRPGFASIIRGMYDYIFEDEAWMKTRTDCKSGPLNIYEMHAGSWKKPGEKQDDWYTYEELADMLVPYLKEYGYNYVEFMPLGEYPSDESWGYQQTGFYAPTSRYGTADQLKKLVDRLHQNGIGVIMDIVPVHFAVDGYALADFDGTALYEYPNDAVGYSEWGSKNFMYSRGESCSFMQSCVDYWLSVFHMDGIRFDAVSRMIYWMGNEGRGENKESIAFLKKMNLGLKTRHPGILLAAEDSTSYPGTTNQVENGGLGFDYKWDMGWMHDTLEFFQMNFFFRTNNYHKLTFSMMYFYNEAFLLPLSHDEVVHGKATIAQKMAGEYDMKIPQVKALYMYMMAHPGKKLNFMGNELAHFREWDEKKEMDWFLLKYPNHDAFHRFIKDLNALYLEHAAFWRKDYTNDGFYWINCDDSSRCTYVFERTDGIEEILTVMHPNDYPIRDYQVNVAKGTYELLLSSCRDIYGGDRIINDGDRIYQTEDGMLKLPELKAFEVLYLKKINDKEAKKKTPAKTKTDAAKPLKKKAAKSGSENTIIAKAKK